MVSFEILTTDVESPARRAVLSTGHGRIQTPAFMPVGTSGAVKGIMPSQLRQTGAQVVLANTYHLMLRPGVECIEKVGGLHRFMNWDGPILTDSGGYQIFSLSRLTRIDEDGVEFSSHVDGARIYLDAEKAIEIQNRLGADIIMCLDQCAAYPSRPAELKRVVERTVAWAKRSKKSHANNSQYLLGIVQGGTDAELRSRRAEELLKMDFDGYAIGGLSVGEGHQEMIRTTRQTAEFLPQDKPRYLMGVGTPADIIAAVAAGIDMFDCVLPTRNGRNALAFTASGAVRMRNSAHINDPGAIEPGCDCYCCRNFTRAAVRHFFNVAEMSGPILVSLHNLRFYQRLMATIRAAIEKGGFSEWAAEQMQKSPYYEQSHPRSLREENGS